MASKGNTSKAINISLWVAQGLLASMFLMAGAMKSTQPIDQLAVNLPWVADASVGLVRFIGISELLGGIGILLPALLRIKPQLTVWAAIGLAVVMVLAAGFHISKGEFEAVGINFILLLLAVFVAWGRAVKAPIQKKNVQ